MEAGINIGDVQYISKPIVETALEDYGKCNKIFGLDAFPQLFFYVRSPTPLLIRVARMFSIS